MISTHDPRADDVRALLERHLAYARAHTNPEEVYALDADALVDPAVTFFGYRLDGELLGVAALKRIDDEHAEIKSMHTAAEARGRGVGRALVDHLLGVARSRGVSRVSLETGSGPAFAAARAPVRERGVRPVRAVRRLPPEPEQHAHDAVAGSGWTGCASRGWCCSPRADRSRTWPSTSPASRSAGAGGATPRAMRSSRCSTRLLALS